MQQFPGAASLLPRLVLALALASPFVPPQRAAAAAASWSAPPLPPHRAAVAAPPAPPPAFDRDVAPLFNKWCVSCHAGDNPEGGLRLDSFEGALRGGDTGPAINPGAPAESLLVAKIERRHRPSMPPRKRVPTAQIAVIRAWIAAGAPP